MHITNSNHIILMCVILCCISVVRAGIGHKDVLKELPIVIRNSRLVNALLCELEIRDVEPKRMDFLGLSSRYVCVWWC